MIFPKAIAQGEAFCNREDERKRLRYNIGNSQHTLVISPRRYGKTSLILKIIDEVKLPYAHVDLFLAFEENKIVERFLDGIAKLVSKIIPINIKALAKIREYFKSFSVSLGVGDVTYGLKLESTHSNYAISLRNAIENLEELLIKHKKKAIFFIDEMQDIVKTDICTDIEATLRFYAQKTQNIAFIFSGSNRKLLKEIFDDRSRPLFKMCDRLNLQRISTESYQKFLNHAAVYKWNEPLPSDVFDEIIILTENHPYYVNYLCSKLWIHDRVPDIDLVKKSWEELCDEEASNLAADIDSLSINQKRLLNYIALKGMLTDPNALSHQQKLLITARGLQQSLKGLLNNDFVEKTKNGIRIVDPLLKTILLK